MIDPESIQTGQCYLTGDAHVRRVVRIMADGRIQYEWRAGHRRRWKSGILDQREFALAAERLMPCDWTSGGSEDDTTMKGSAA
jgi:hypothetical protein